MKYINMVMSDEEYEKVKRATIQMSQVIEQTLTVTEYARITVLQVAEDELKRSC